MPAKNQSINLNPETPPPPPGSESKPKAPAELHIKSVRFTEDKTLFGGSISGKGVSETMTGVKITHDAGSGSVFITKEHHGDVIEVKQAGISHIVWGS